MLIKNLSAYSQIEAAVQAIPGWSPMDQLLTLFTLAYTSANLPSDILELGSWCGRSAVALGIAAKLTGKGRLHCVDLFPEKDDWFKNDDGTYSFAVTLEEKIYGAYQEQTVWAEPYLKDTAPLYERFGGTLEAFNLAIKANLLQDIVLPYRTDSEGFTKKAPKDFALRLAFIDGDHSFDAVSRDIAIIECYLLPGGRICFDDAFSSYEGVNQAIEESILASGKYELGQQMTRKLFVARRR